ncbi:MAG: hypothetical protein R2734_11785 [Nocardioides sp.]
MDPTPPLSAGAPRRLRRARASRTRPSCCAARPAATRRHSPRCTTPPPPGCTGWRCAWCATRRRPREVAQEAFQDLADREPLRPQPRQRARLDAHLTHRRAVDRVRSAEAATRRDETYERESQPVAHDLSGRAGRPRSRHRGARRRPG